MENEQENNDNFKYWAKIIIAIITVIGIIVTALTPIVVAYIQKSDSNPNLAPGPEIALHATQTQVAIEAAQAEIYATQTAIARLLNQPTPQVAPTNRVYTD